MRRILIAFSCFFTAIMFAACSGGNSSSQDSSTVQMSSSGSATGSVTITNPALPSTGGTTDVAATFKKTDGKPASGINVNFSTTLGTISPANAIAVTDLNGTATVQLTVGATSGQGQITATATVDNKQVTKTGLFSVNLPSLKLSAITLDVDPLGYGGATNVSVSVLKEDGVTPYTDLDIDVTFSSVQASSGNSTLNSPVKTIGGKASTTYTATTATGTDTITASIAGASVSKSFNIIPLSAGSISFVSASPTTIGIKGIGGVGLVENSTVIFKVLDTSGQELANQKVDFKLSTTVGGITTSTTQGSTAKDGTVSVIVKSGSVATPVRVQATISGTTVSTQSDQLVISTGLPSQDHMSVAFDTLNSESFSLDGTKVVLTVTLADHFGNPVPDGTAVTFTSQYGKVDPSCTTLKGVCTAEWVSSGDRGLDGKNAILVYAIGEEKFIDFNGNGVADTVEFTDDTQAWADYAHTGLYDITKDPFIDYNKSGQVVGDSVFNGVLIPDPTTSVLKHIFRNPVVIMSTSGADITLVSASPVSSNPASIVFNVSGLNGRAMAAGTKINLDASFGTLSTTEIIVPSTTADPVNQTVIWSTDAAVPPVSKSGTIKINVTSPVTSTVTTLTIPISGSF